VEFQSVYVTTKDAAEARAIGMQLVEKKLAACVNVIPQIESIYRWAGKIEQEKEAALIAKTRAELVEDVIAEIKTLHSYDCPCVVSWPMAKGNPDYFNWIAAETRDANS